MADELEMQTFSYCVTIEMYHTISETTLQRNDELLTKSETLLTYIVVVDEKRCVT